MSFSIRTDYDPSGAPEIKAMRWEPGDPYALGCLVGALLAAGADFHHPDGYGASTTLAIKTPDGEIVAEPDDWILGNTQDWQPRHPLPAGLTGLRISPAGPGVIVEACLDPEEPSTR